ncbi:MAG: SGNH/GDSL hydrolase family protein [Ignavibacteriaceae bacterium]|jgi:lysophospholipase L1-like esterase
MNNILLGFCLILFLFNLPGYSQNDNAENDWANLKRYAKADKKLGPPAAGENRVVFMGNSITESWAVIDSSFFTENKSFVDRGISGQTSSQMLLRFRQDVIDLKPAVVVILAGTNDIAENTGPITLKDIFGNIISMVQLAEMNKIKVILSSVLPAYDFPWHPGLKPAEKIVKLNLMLKSYCEENNIKYTDYYSKMVDERGGLDKRYTNDGVHPTIAGYKIMDSIIEDAIKVELNKPGY